MSGLIVTKFRRDDDGVLHARVSLNGRTVDVDNAAGSWLASVRIPRTRRFNREFVMPNVAAELQRRARRLERREAGEEVEVND